MTDILDRSPNDSGEIPTPQVLAALTETTQLNLFVDAPPALRRPDATGELPLYVLRPPVPSDTGHLPIIVDVDDRQAHDRPHRYQGSHRDPSGTRARYSLPSWLRRAVDTVRGSM